MSEKTFWTVIGIFAVVLIAYGGVIALLRERVATLEADSKTTKEEVKGLRMALHDVRAKLSETVASWFLKLSGKKQNDD